MSTPDIFAGLMERVAVERDRTAFTVLFDHFAPRLKAYLMRLGAEPATAEEITQDVMVTLWRKAHLFDSRKSSLATWLFRVARNRRIDVLRRARTAELDPTDPFFSEELDEDADAALDAQLREERVRIAMKALPHEQLSLVRLAFFDGLSHSQIAEETGLPLGTVKSRIRLAFSRLRRLLEQDDAVDLN